MNFPKKATYFGGQTFDHHNNKVQTHCIYNIKQVFKAISEQVKIKLRNLSKSYYDFYKRIVITNRQATKQKSLKGTK